MHGLLGFVHELQVRQLLGDFGSTCLLVFVFALRLALAEQDGCSLQLGTDAVK